MSRRTIKALFMIGQYGTLAALLLWIVTANKIFQIVAFPALIFSVFAMWELTDKVFDERKEGAE